MAVAHSGLKKKGKVIAVYADQDKAAAHADYASIRRLKERQAELLAAAAIDAMKKRGQHFQSGFREKLMDLIFFAI